MLQDLARGAMRQEGQQREVLVLGLDLFPFAERMILCSHDHQFFPVQGSHPQFPPQDGKRQTADDKIDYPGTHVLNNDRPLSCLDVNSHRRILVLELLEYGWQEETQAS